VVEINDGLMFERKTERQNSWRYWRYIVGTVPVNSKNNMSEQCTTGRASIVVML
jgi:hypothetical protein